MSHYAMLAPLAFRVLAVVPPGSALFTSLILARFAAGMGSSVMLAVASEFGRMET